MSSDTYGGKLRIFNDGLIWAMSKTGYAYTLLMMELIWAFF
ncbi:hypothetical protein [Nostoc sp.]